MSLLLCYLSPVSINLERKLLYPVQKSRKFKRLKKAANLTQEWNGSSDAMDEDIGTNAFEILMKRHLIQSNSCHKQITVKTSNLIIYICITCRCYLNLFVKIGQKTCAHKRILTYILSQKKSTKKLLANCNEISLVKTFEPNMQMI